MSLAHLVTDMVIVIAPAREMPDHEWRWNSPILMISDELTPNEQLEALTDAVQAILFPGSVAGITYT